MFQPLKFGVCRLFNLNFKSQSHYFLLKGTWQKELNHQLRFETDKMTNQISQIVLSE